MIDPKEANADAILDAIAAICRKAEDLRAPWTTLDNIVKVIESTGRVVDDPEDEEEVNV